jgi:hypothetical protein
MRTMKTIPKRHRPLNSGKVAINYENFPSPKTWNCLDCGFNTAPGCSTRIDALIAFMFDATKEGVEQSIGDDAEVYTVHERVWARAGVPPGGGCLCIGCLEGRIGRRLKPKDFDRDHPFNQMPGTERLLSRRERGWR